MPHSRLLNARVLILLPVYSIFYLMSSILPVYGIMFTDTLLFLGGLTSISILSSLCIISSLLRPKIGIVTPDNKKLWLELNSIFKILELSILMIIFIFTIFLLYDPRFEEMRSYVVIWFLLTGSLIFPLFNWVKNVFGMEFKVIENGSIIGAGAFASLALEFLSSEKEDEKQKGLSYLIVVIQMLNRSLNRDDLSLEHLEEVELMLKALLAYGSTIPYERLKTLCRGFANLPDMSDVASELENYTKVKELQWTRKFRRIKKLEKRKALEYSSVVLSIVIGILAVLAEIDPETLKSTIMNYLGQVNWINLSVVVIIFIIFSALISFLERWQETYVPLGDIKRLSD